MSNIGRDEQAAHLRHRLSWTAMRSLFYDLRKS
jgi:hypothetical protein